MREVLWLLLRFLIYWYFNQEITDRVVILLVDRRFTPVVEQIKHDPV